jgi:hypothetical protein
MIVIDIGKQDKQANITIPITLFIADILTFTSKPAGAHQPA